MLPLQETSCFLGSFAHNWDPEFRRRRELDYNDENKPYVEHRKGPDEGYEHGTDFHTGDDIIKFFMGDPEEPDLYQAEEVQDFCSGVILHAQQTGSSMESRLVALLDDRNNAGPEAKCRPYKGALTAHRLYEELKKMVGNNLRIKTSTSKN
ncbi:hypothetical protein DL95DRAFT_472158 [Leptodontidium sp. 2 PMI_412]|nr:hypothetical protein DL95DRAFT_472158 [Leptodontidium sp. 2 PMI_412]